MSILVSLVSDLSTAAKFGAFIAWWVAVYLGIQTSRYRGDPKASQFLRNWKIAMLVFVGLLVLVIVTGIMATLLAHR